MAKDLLNGQGFLRRLCRECAGSKSKSSEGWQEGNCRSRQKGIPPGQIFREEPKLADAGRGGRRRGFKKKCKSRDARHSGVNLAAVLSWRVLQLLYFISLPIEGSEIAGHF